MTVRRRTSEDVVVNVENDEKYEEMVGINLIKIESEKSIGRVSLKLAEDQKLVMKIIENDLESGYSSLNRDANGSSIIIDQNNITHVTIHNTSKSLIENENNQEKESGVATSILKEGLVNHDTLEQEKKEYYYIFDVQKIKEKMRNKTEFGVIQKIGEMVLSIQKVLKELKL